MTDTPSNTDSGERFKGARWVSAFIHNCIGRPLAVVGIMALVMGEFALLDEIRLWFQLGYYPYAPVGLVWETGFGLHRPDFEMSVLDGLVALYWRCPLSPGFLIPGGIIAVSGFWMEIGYGETLIRRMLYR